MSANKGNILIATVQVPFTRGGAEILVDCLKEQLCKRGFNVDIVQLPFSADPKEELVNQVAMWKALDLSKFNGKRVDLVICTKFPSYMVRHPNKVLWLVHQHRQIYDLYGSRFGDFSGTIDDEALRRLIVSTDREALSECRAIYGISQNVVDRLDRYLDIKASTLMPPLPLGNRYKSGQKGDYILSVGRICSIKRVDYLIKALPMIDDRLKVKIVGVPDEPKIESYLNNEIEKHHLWHRVEFLGRVSEDKLLDLFSNAHSIYYAPFDEDYGFVTLEALASSKPVVTCNDSGGVLEFIKHEHNGLVAEPREGAIAEQFNRLLHEPGLYDKLQPNTASSFSISNWQEVVEKLTAEVNPVPGIFESSKKNENNPSNPL